MKKIISLILCFNIFCFNGAFAFVDVFEDSLAKNLDKNLKIEKQEKINEADEFAKESLNPSLKIQKQKLEPIGDNLAKSTLDPNLKIAKNKTTPIADETVKLLSTKEIKKEAAKQKTSFSDANEIKIKIRPQKYYTTRTNLFEGDYINFELAQDSEINNKIYKEGTPIKARVENVSLNGAYGVPADVVIGNFILDNKTKLDGEMSLTGANRSLWVYPVGYTLTLLLGVGILIFPIRGGHVKFKSDKVYEFVAFE